MQDRSATPCERPVAQPRAALRVAAAIRSMCLHHSSTDFGTGYALDLGKVRCYNAPPK